MLRKFVRINCVLGVYAGMLKTVILGQQDPREIITFTFSILSNQSDCIPSEILPSLFKRCFQYAVMLGVEDEVNDNPSSIVASLTDSAVRCHNKVEYHNITLVSCYQLIFVTGYVM